MRPNNQNTITHQSSATPLHDPVTHPSHLPMSFPTPLHATPGSLVYLYITQFLMVFHHPPFNSLPAASAPPPSRCLVWAPYAVIPTFSMVSPLFFFLHFDLCFRPPPLYPVSLTHTSRSAKHILS